ncbi:MAG: F420-nonreducing hydrogenase [Candidatus Thorarchaeota archaeon]|nr:F420-nonreducing hydrogenase [Candidatus Thorarchaeota archaeon]
MTASIAMGQGSSCWGCFQSLVDIHLKLADVLPLLDIKYWATVVDYKLHDLEAQPDNSIDIGLFEGTARTVEDVHLLRALRAKCKTLVAFGSCSCFGGIPSLANIYDLDECIDVKFRHNKTVSDGQLPTVGVPALEPVIRPNNEIVKFDVYLPGCPPTPSLIVKAVTSLITGAPLDLPTHTVCHYCPREKKDTPVEEFKRPFEGIADRNRCLLEQGYLCMGASTWGLCEGACVSKGAPCRGCFGPPPPIMADHGAASISMLGTYAPQEPRKILESVSDPLGMFWRFTYATSHLGSMRIKREEAKRK